MASLISDIVGLEASAIGLSLSASELRLFELYAAELKKWNSKVNLTAITKDSEIAIKHFVDSLVVASYLTEHDNLLDIGSGAGLPVIPLKIIRPEIRMFSVDAVAKKILFQRHVIRTLDLRNIEATHERVESLHATHAGMFSVITSRAFTRLDRFVRLAAPLLSEEGVIIAMKGDQADGEIADSLEYVSSSGFEITDVRRYSLPRGMGERVLTCMKRSKVR